jgi:hypothetical protein
MALALSTIKRVQAHTEFIKGAEYSHNASMLATVSQDKTAVIWETTVCMPSPRHHE